MTRLSLVSSWFLSVFSAIVAVELEQYHDSIWLLIAAIGFGICRFLRTGAPKITDTVEHPFKSHPTFSASYYLLLLIVSIYIALNKPEALDTSGTVSFFVLFILICFPLVPAFIKHEAYLYELTGKKPDN